MKQSVKSIAKLVQYDLIIFFREPFFALPTLLLPGFFFVVYASAFGKAPADRISFGQYIPTYMLLISYLTVFFQIGTQYVTDKQNGIFKRLLLSPIRLLHVVISYSIRGVLVSVLGFFEMTVLAGAVLRIPLSENMLRVFFVFLLLASIMMLLSISIHGFIKNAKSVMLFSILCFQYVFFSTGMIMPVEKMPAAVRFFVYLNPIYHMNQVLVSAWYQTRQSAEHVLALAAWVILCLLFVRHQKGFAMDK